MANGIGSFIFGGGGTSVGSLVAHITANLSGLNRGLTEAGRKISVFSANLQTKLEKNGMAMRRLGMAATVLGAAISASMLGMTKKFGDFDKAMRKATAVSDVTNEQFVKMSTMAEQQALRLNTAATQTAEAFYFLGSAGLEADDQMKAFVPTVTLAKAATIEMGRAAEIVVDTMKGFSIEFKNTTHVTDVLAKAVTSSNMTFDQLGQTMSMVSGLARTTNNSLEDTVTAVAAMADVGIKGTRAGTTLRRSLLNLAAPTSEIRQLFDDYKIAVYDSNGVMKPFIQLVGEISEALKDASEEQRNMAFKAMFGARAITGQLAIFDKGVDELRKFSEALRVSGGAAEEVAQKQMATLNEQMGKLGQKFNIMFRTAGSKLAPVLMGLANVLSPIIMLTTELMDKFPRLTTLLVTMVTTFGLLITTIGLASVAFISFSLAASALGISLGALAIKIGLVTGGLSLLAGLLVVGGYSIYKMRTTTVGLDNSLKSLNKTVKDTSESWEIYNSTLKKSERGQMISKSQRLIQIALMQEQANLNRLKAQWESMTWYTKKLMQARYIEMNIAANQRITNLRRQLREVEEWRDAEVKAINDVARARGELTERTKEIAEIERMIRYEKGFMSLAEQEQIANQQAVVAWKEYLQIKKTGRDADIMDAYTKLVELIQVHKGFHDELREVEIEGQEAIEDAKKEITLLNIDDTNERAIEASRQRYEEDLENFKGTEIQKAEFQRVLWEKHQAEITRINEDATKKNSQAATQMVNGIQSSMSRALTEMAKGSTEMMDNVNNFITGIHETMIRAITDMIAQWLMFKMITGFVPGGAGLAGGMGLTNPFAGGMKKGGVVYAQSGLAVPQGSDTVPAMLTPGEMVLPKGMTGWLKNQLKVPQGGTGEGQSPTMLNINVNAIDAKGTFDFLNKNKRNLASMLKKAGMNNHPMRR